MTDFDALRETFMAGNTPEWILYRGFSTNLRERAIRVGEQKSKEVSLEDSFEDLMRRINWNSGGGGDFTVFIPTKASNQGETIFFRVDGPATAAIGNMPMLPAQLGFLTREDLERERRLWELERRNEELEDAINGPSGWWQTLLQGLLEDGTVKEMIGAIKSIGVEMLRQKSGMTVAAPATVSGVPPVNEIEYQDDGFEYDDAAFEFLDSLRQHFGEDTSKFYSFITKLNALFKQNPTLWVNLVTQKN
ncbi:MAG TPA: hypothetical protein PKE68_03610 [Saprospiraceae bacterium]|nr:hypothetical protein [Saprospiraceae bacterium]